MRFFLMIVVLLCAHFTQAQPIKTSVLSDGQFWYHLHMVNDTTKINCVLRSITIVSKSDASKVQEIIIDTIKNESNNEISCDTGNLNKNEWSDFIIEDLDFDGYNDFRFVITPKPAYCRNVSYTYWRYNPKLQLFEKDLALDTVELHCPTFDQSAKQISTYDDDMGVDPDRSHTATIYEYHKGKLTDMGGESVLLNTNSKGQKYTITQRDKVINGKRKIVYRKIKLVPEDKAELIH